MNMKTILLSLTEKCNLNCRYCYENFKRNRSMNFETAIKIIDSSIVEYKEINVSFFGGEPFLNFELMKKIVEHYWNNDCVVYSCSTNGTLIHGEIKEWILEHRKKFTYSLSFDGDKYTQDYNRSNSFNLVDLYFYKEMYGDNARVKMTLFPDTIENLFNSVKYLTDLGIKISANCAYGTDWDEKTLGIFKEQLMLLCNYYIENNLQPFSFLDIDICKLAYPRSNKPWCGIDKLCAYDVNGKRYPCQFFEEISQGEDVDVVIDVEHLEDYVPTECKSCSFYNLCPLCLGSNYKKYKSFNYKDDDVCKLFKLQLYANAIYTTEKIKKHGIDAYYKNSKEKNAVLKAIKIIASELQ